MTKYRTPQAPGTIRALASIARGEKTAYRAAKDEGIALSTVYRAMKRQRIAAQKAAESS